MWPCILNTWRWKTMEDREISRYCSRKSPLSLSFIIFHPIFHGHFNSFLSRNHCNIFSFFKKMKFDMSVPQLSLRNRWNQQVSHLHVEKWAETTKKACFDLGPQELATPSLDTTLEFEMLRRCPTARTTIGLKMVKQLNELNQPPLAPIEYGKVFYCFPGYSWECGTRE